MDSTFRRGIASFAQFLATGSPSYLLLHDNLLI